METVGQAASSEQLDDRDDSADAVICESMLTTSVFVIVSLAID